MIHFLNKLWNDSIDDSVHSQFVRFGKGIFERRFVFRVRKGDKVRLNSTFELANDFVEFVSEIGGGKVAGKVLSREDISGIMSKNRIKGNSETKKGGLFYENNIDEQEISKEALRELVKNSYFCLLDVEGKDFSLKIKKTIPKPNPKGANSKVNDKFCILEIPGSMFSKVREEFLFELPEGKKYEVEHSVAVNEIILPKDESNPEQMRLKAKRKGIIKRKAIVDGKEIVKEREFIA